MPSLHQRIREGLAGIALIAITFAVYWPVRENGFVNYDDPNYIVENPIVRAGLTGDGFAWALTNPLGGNWHPLTTLSHMLDCELFGLRAGAHHLVNVGFHALNAVLLFLFLGRIGARFWISLACAALFALHPQHVESVAWASERKDVLNEFFGLLTLITYVRFATSAPGGKRRVSYWLMVVFFALGLMAKPMLVTLPLILLLLDFWPLRRGSVRQSNDTWRAWRGLLMEKLPLFALSLGISIATWSTQKSSGAVSSIESIGVGARLANAVVSMVRYLGKTFYPADLSVFYPYSPDASVLSAVAAGVVLLGITAAVFQGANRRGYLLVGWLWFVITLLPVIGLVQVGSQAMADRYMYLPHIGLLLMLTFAGQELSTSRVRNVILAGLAGITLIAFARHTREQIGYWKDTETLFRHALKVTQNNTLAHFHLGVALASRGANDEATEHIQTILKLDPNNAEALGMMGFLESEKGQTIEAIRYYEAAIQEFPRLHQALNNLAWLRAAHAEARFRDGTQAINLATQAIQSAPYPNPLYLGTLAAAYAEAGRFPDAIAAAQKAIDLARAAGEVQIVRRNTELLELYRQGRPFHESAQQ